MSASSKSTHRRAAAWKFLVLMILASSLAACTLLPGAEPARTFILPVGAQAPSSNAPLDATLQVATPRANAILKNRRILVMPSSNELSVYKGARWSTDVPVLLRDRLIEAFRQSGRLTGVFAGSAPVRSDFMLLSELDAFHSEYQADTPWVVIRLDAQLIEGASRRLLANRYFTVRIKSEGTRIESVVDAFGRAADELSEQLLDWGLANIADHVES
ncbi:ABC-type transport auxiliary lipoprotein family protein [Halomonas sp. GXIMD04776]|uniref:ABC-type transport auxiliary lipoprotein family protein n=1 Tax=Halomonas sp. GXIMD04776 TaxID=3415605 RepID=UPI003CB8D7CF